MIDMTNGKSELCRKAMEFIAFAFTCFLLSYYVFSYQFTSNLELEIVGHYRALPISLTVLTTFLIVSAFVVAEPPTYLKVIYLAIIIYLSILYFLRFSIFYSGNEHFSNILTWAVAGYIFIFYLPIGRYRSVIFFISLLTVSQVIIGYKQILQNSQYEELALEIAGSFQNSGAFSAFLVTSYPFLLYSLSFLKGRIKFVFIGLAFCAICFLLIVTISRSSILLFLFINVGLIIYEYWSSIMVFIKSHKGFTICSVIVGVMAVITLVVFLYKLKVRSAQGRVLIWDICLMHWKENALTGYGLGSFQYNYPLWQADYFRANPIVKKEYFLAAGDTVVAFNEYVQMLAETGLLGLIFFLASIGTAVLCSCRSINVKTATYLKLSIVGICLLGCTFYPFHCTAISMIFLLSFLVLIKDSIGYRQLNPSNFWAARQPIFYLALAGWLFFPLKRSWDDYFMVGRLEKIEYENEIRPSDSVYLKNSIYPQLRTDGKILTRMGNILLSYGDNEGVSFLQEGTNYFRGYINVNYLANACLYLNRKDQALAAFDFLSFYIPSKFSPKYEMFKIYRDQGRKREACNMARIITAMPIKIDSYQSQSIRLEASNYVVKNCK